MCAAFYYVESTTICTISWWSRQRERSRSWRSGMPVAVARPSDDKPPNSAMKPTPRRRRSGADRAGRVSRARDSTRGSCRESLRRSRHSGTRTRPNRARRGFLGSGIAGPAPAHGRRSRASPSPLKYRQWAPRTDGWVRLGPGENEIRPPLATSHRLRPPRRPLRAWPSRGGGRAHPRRCRRPSAPCSSAPR